MKQLIIISLIALSIKAMAQTKETEVTGKIKDVVVFTSSAEIHAEKKVAVSKGRNTIVFSGLPLYIIQNSVNVSVSDPNVQIVTVTEKFNFIKEKKGNNTKAIALQDSITKLNKQNGLLAVKKESLGTEKNLLFRGESIGGLAQGVKVEEMQKASDFFSKRHYELAKEIYDIEQKEEANTNLINRYEKHIKELQTVVQEASSEIIILLDAQTEKEFTLSVTLLTPKAGWSPLYDFKYNGPDKPVSMSFRANVFNASGINWDNVKIKLSTAQPDKGFSLPSSETDSNSGVKFKQVEIMNAFTEYKIAHNYDIPSDAKPYLLEVDKFELAAKFNYLLIPKLDPYGFLIAKIPDWNKHNLIPGTANIFNMGTFMGKTNINTFADNDTLELFLGKDKQIQSMRSESTTENKHTIIGNNVVDETKVLLSVKNNSANALNVEIVDLVPETDSDEKLTFNGIGCGVYDKTEARLTWKTNIKPDQSLKLDYKYEFKYPKSRFYGAYKKKFRTIACPSF